MLERIHAAQGVFVNKFRFYILLVVEEISAITQDETLKEIHRS